MLWRIAAIGACYVYALTFFVSWLQTYLVRGHGYTEAALVLSTLPYVIGGIANGCGGLLSDWLVRRLGLRRGRRAVGVVRARNRGRFHGGDHADVERRLGTWVPVAGLCRHPAAAAQHLRGLPRHGPQARWSGVRVHEHRGQRRGGRLVGGIRIHRDVFRQLQRALLARWSPPCVWEHCCGSRSTRRRTSSKKSSLSSKPWPDGPASSGVSVKSGGRLGMGSATSLRHSLLYQ